MVRVRDDHAVVNVTTDAVAINVVVSIKWTCVAYVAESIAVAIELVAIGDARAVVNVTADAVAINVVVSIKWTAVAIVRDSITIAVCARNEWVWIVGIQATIIIIVVIDAVG